RVRRGTRSHESQYDDNAQSTDGISFVGASISSEFVAERGAGLPRVKIRLVTRERVDQQIRFCRSAERAADIDHESAQVAERKTGTEWDLGEVVVLFHARVRRRELHVPYVVALPTESRGDVRVDGVVRQDVVAECTFYGGADQRAVRFTGERVHVRRGAE